MGELPRILVALVLLSWMLFHNMVARQMPEPVLQMIGSLSTVGLVDFVSVQAARPAGAATWILFVAGVCSAAGIGVLLAIAARFRLEGDALRPRRSCAIPLLWGVLLVIHGGLLVLAQRLSIASETLRPSLLPMIGVSYDVYCVMAAKRQSRLTCPTSSGKWAGQRG